MFPRPSRLLRLIILLSVTIFIVISLYIITFEGHDMNTFTEYKLKTKFSTTGIIGHLESHFTIQHDQNLAVTVMQRPLYSSTGEHEHLFHDMVLQQLEQYTIVPANHVARQKADIKIPINGVNPHNFAYIHNPNKICYRNVTFLVYIHSSPENLKKRQAVRQTWGHPKLLSLYNATLMFVLGRVLKPAVQRLINMEASRYGDILQEDFIDSYRNLTYKGLAGLKWAGTFCAHTEFLLKTDDDILVDIVSVMESLYTKIFPSRGSHTKLVLCNVWTRMKVIRDPKSKWYVSKEEFTDDYFPVYCSGSAYLLSGDLIPALYATAIQTPFFWVDDYYVTGMLVNKLKIPHTRFNSAYLLNYNVAEDKLKNDSRELLIFHVKKLSLFLKIWPLIMQRHKGMEKYLMPVTMFSLRHNKQTYLDVSASDDVIEGANNKQVDTTRDNIVDIATHYEINTASEIESSIRPIASVNFI